jgi:hypothetical protein
MNQKTFTFNSVEYDIRRFVLAKSLFLKIEPTKDVILSEDLKPLYSEEFTIPVIMKYRGIYIVMACSNKEDAMNSKEYLLANKHKLKGAVHQPYQPEMEEREHRSYNRDNRDNRNRAPGNRRDFNNRSNNRSTKIR